MGCAVSSTRSLRSRACCTLSRIPRNSALEIRPSWLVSSSSKGLSTEDAAKGRLLVCSIRVMALVSSSSDTSPSPFSSNSSNSSSGVSERSCRMAQSPAKKIPALDSGLVIWLKSFIKKTAARSRCSRCFPTAPSAMPRTLNSTRSGFSSSDMVGGLPGPCCACADGGGVGSMIRRMRFVISSIEGGSSNSINAMPIRNSSKVMRPELSLSRKQKRSFTVNFLLSIHSLIAQRVHMLTCSISVISVGSFVSQAR
mmetsp:Transcript_38510/g.81701  ORF Transcript_38510/g.81701 Transcript_38510/m.81701 type:complete len:254 (-) Transcript_38510:401-1162(-)